MAELKNGADLSGSGIDFPTLELGGITYTIKFTRATILYRLSRAGVSFTDLQKRDRRFAALHDILFAAIQDQYEGTVESLVELIYAEGKGRLVDAAVAAAIKKVFPPTQPVPETAEVRQTQGPDLQ